MVHFEIIFEWRCMYSTSFECMLMYVIPDIIHVMGAAFA